MNRFKHDLQTDVYSGVSILEELAEELRYIEKTMLQWCIWEGERKVIDKSLSLPLALCIFWTIVWFVHQNKYYTNVWICGLCTTYYLRFVITSYYLFNLQDLNKYITFFVKLPIIIIAVKLNSYIVVNKQISIEKKYTNMWASASHLSEAQ